MAFDSERDRPPISQHRAFPAIVALWFALLLGFGSLVLPAALLERGVALSGIAAYVPAANPPLGLNARGLIAAAAALLGALLGIVIARRVARTHDIDDDDYDDMPSRSPLLANGARRPIDVNAELGGEGLANDFGRPLTRRRALAIAEEDLPSDTEDDQPVDAFDAAPPATDAPDPVPAYGEPSYTPEIVDAYEPYQPVEPSAQAWDHAETVNSEDDAPMSFSQDFEPLPPEPEVGSQPEAQQVPPAREADPLPFAAPSQAQHPAEPAAFVAEPEAEPRQEAQPAPAAREAEPLPFAAPLQARRPVEPQAAAAEPEPGEPELAQLVRRLKSSLERRREELASSPMAEPAPPPASPAGFEPAPAEDAVQAMASYFARPAAAVAPATHFADEHEEEHEEEHEDEEADSAYSSLLAMRGPYTPGAGIRPRIDEPAAEEDPVEPEPEFEAPVSEAEAPVDTDAALRAALAKLQRMGGGA